MDKLKDGQTMDADEEDGEVEEAGDRMEDVDEQEVDEGEDEEERWWSSLTNEEAAQWQQQLACAESLKLPDDASPEQIRQAMDNDRMMLSEAMQLKVEQLRQLYMSNVASASA